ncbi:tRNA glutamyl-Q(34) synthetase GluQRS [Porticoccaceae bacterium]|nr:tRNA glutamyl-Q(34) synthetase GluQRS [Porticoccaceae bacterium]
MSALSSIARFAPSPTGPLHFGSLVTALASFLDARQRLGQWLVRIEDLDPPREVAGASDQILRQLESHGLCWDGTVLYQSTRLEAYAAALESLLASELVYHCRCNRQRIQSLGGIYDGHCSELQLPSNDCAARLRVNDTRLSFNDQIIGQYQQNLKTELGDFVVRRRDGLFSYQLAVVVDDEFQAISHIMRGADLLESTPRQIYLQQCLGYKTPDYAHLPLALNAQGQKLSKQNQALELPEGNESEHLWAALHWLQQSPPEQLQRQSVAKILAWGIEHWAVKTVTDHLQDSLAPEGY